MRDEIDGRLWSEHGDGFADGVDEAARRLWAGLRRLHAHLFAAPWAENRCEPAE